MRKQSLTIAAAIVGMVGVPRTLAQAPAVDSPQEIASAPACPLDGVLPECPPRPPSSTVDFIFGLPTGFRFQRAVDDERQWHLEAFAGLELIFPMAGGGIRRRYEPLCGKHDALVVAPGVDAYLLYNPLHGETGFLIGGGPVLGYAITADIDLMWRHSFTENCQSQFGFKLGAGAGYGARWGVLPVAGVFTGIRW